MIRLLRSIPQDCTYHQGKVFQWYQEIESKGKTSEICSLDLTAATDRLPLRIQACVIRNSLKDIPGSYHLSYSWKRLMKDFTYFIKLAPGPHRPASAEFYGIRYGAGQGIGLYTS